MINQKKIDRLRALPDSDDTFKCEILTTSGEIDTQKNMSHTRMRAWLIREACFTPMKMVRVTNENTGEIL